MFGKIEKIQNHFKMIRIVSQNTQKPRNGPQKHYSVAAAIS